MSRPFSYNDENFTVIGNLLFVHFKYEDKANTNARLIEIPPAIYDRLLFLTCLADINYSTSTTKGGGNVPIRAVDYDGKHYLSNIWSLSAETDRYIFCTFMLKDI